jgi:predicted secreted protein
MASTGFRNGTDLSIFINGTEVAFASTHDLNMNMATREVTNKDSAGWTEKREAVRDWDTSGEAFFAEDAAYGFTDLFAFYNSRTSVTVKFSTNVSGDIYYTGSAYLTSLSQSDPLEDSATFSFSLEGTGVLTEATLT